MNKFSRAAVYIRVSTKNQADKYSLAYQERLAKSLIENNKWSFTKVYEDRGISGLSGPDKRLGLQYLLEDAQENVFDKVVIFSVDRLGRSQDVVNNIYYELQGNNIGIVSCTENTDTKENIQDLADRAYTELKIMRHRQDMGREQKKLESGYIGGSLPYGYSKIDGIISINPTHANVVRSIYEAYHIKKFSLRKIALCLDNENIKTPKGGKKWHQSSLITILDNKHKYEGCVINNNENNICWPVILINAYPNRIKRK